MVAAWINAETGVGPAIASGNQVNSGICADLPIAPMNKLAVIKIIIGESNSNFEEFCATERKSTALVW